MIDKVELFKDDTKLLCFDLKENCKQKDKKKQVDENSVFTKLHKVRIICSSSFLTIIISSL